jgi:ubiquinone/menaquinone biosynthesis C-methylase UbiE
MKSGIDTKRALSFQKTAQLYDKVRPGYPSSWIADLQKITNIDSKTTILEAGYGTGIATTDLIKVTEHITCLDPGKGMLAVAKTKFPDLNFVHSTFEKFKSDELFNMIVSAMAWHWVDPNVGYKKASDLLTKPGFLAIIRYYHIDDDPKSFHNQAQHIYEKYNKDTVTKRNAEQLKRIKQDAQALNNKYFRLVEKIEYKWQQNYSIDGYLALRNTYSDHLTTPPAVREKMEKELREFAQKEFGGNVVKKYTTVLFVAQKTTQLQ